MSKIEKDAITNVEKAAITTWTSSCGFTAVQKYSSRLSPKVLIGLEYSGHGLVNELVLGEPFPPWEKPTVGRHKLQTCYLCYLNVEMFKVAATFNRMRCHARKHEDSILGTFKDFLLAFPKSK